MGLLSVLWLVIMVNPMVGWFIYIYSYIAIAIAKFKKRPYVHNRHYPGGWALFPAEETRLPKHLTRIRSWVNPPAPPPPTHMSMSFWAVCVAHVAVLADHWLGLGWWILGVRPSLESAELLAEAEVLQLQPGDHLDGRRCLGLAPVQLSGER